MTKQQLSSTRYCQRKSDIMDKYGSTAKDFLLTVTPSQQPILYKDIQDCYFGDYPTLSELNGAYSPKTAQAWLVPQLLDLSEYCGVKEKFTTNQLNQCSDIIANDYAYLKVSEIMLFFARFKRCHYGHLYGTVDPLIIIGALKEFCCERNVAYYERNKNKEEQRISESLKNTCSWKEYAERNGKNDKQFSSFKKNVESCKISKKETKDTFKEKVYDIAKNLIENSYGCDIHTLNIMRIAFEKKYGCTPEGYLKL